MTIHEFKSITLAAGDTQSLQFNFKYKSKDIADVSSFKAYFVLSTYGFEDENVLSLPMNRVTGTVHSYRVTLTSNDTINLLGTYTMKVVLVDDEGNYYKKARGVLNIHKDSDGVEVTI